MNFTATTAPADMTNREIVLDTIFGLVRFPVQIDYSWNYDGSLESIEGVALADLPSEYVAKGDRLAVTPENLVPLVRVNWSQLATKRAAVA